MDYSSAVGCRRLRGGQAQELRDGQPPAGDLDKDCCVAECWRLASARAARQSNDKSRSVYRSRSQMVCLGLSALLAPTLTHRIPSHLDAMGVVHEPVEYAVGQRGIAYLFGPRRSGKETPTESVSLEEGIRQRAYELYISRGSQSGSEPSRERDSESRADP